MRAGADEHIRRLSSLDSSGLTMAWTTRAIDTIEHLRVTGLRQDSRKGISLWCHVAMLAESGPAHVGVGTDVFGRKSSEGKSSRRVTAAVFS